MEFRITTHTVTGKPEVWRNGEFIASIYDHEDGLRLVSKYLDGVERRYAPKYSYQVLEVGEGEVND